MGLNEGLTIRLVKIQPRDKMPLPDQAGRVRVHPGWMR